MLRTWALILSAIFFVSPLSAQGLPAGMSVEQAVTLLQTNPGLQNLVRQRLAASGLTREQIHERLRAAGYNETILDPYITDTPNAAPVAATSLDARHSFVA